MTLQILLLLIGGLALLFVGGELLVRGASRLAAAAGISPLIVGLTVVAFGTSAPEMAVSVQAGLAGQADIAIGNVVGSNIGNVLFILGISALIAPLIVAQNIVRRDVPLMIGVSIGLWLMALDGVLNRLEGVVLFAGIVAYTVYAIREGRRESAAVRSEYEAAFGKERKAATRESAVNLALVVGGIGLLVIGAGWLVDGAVSIARWLGLSELIIGLTIVAMGTSLPELATSVIAAIRGQRDIAVGNVVGSNLFNILSVLGLTAIAAPAGVQVPQVALNFDIPVMTAVAVACLPVFFSGYRIARWEGGLFLAYYVAYTAYLVLGAADHDALPVFSAAMMGFVMPLTAVTLIVVAVRGMRAARQPAAG
jgi:cation:H+ antiporter